MPADPQTPESTQESTSEAEVLTQARSEFLAGETVPTTCPRCDEVLLCAQIKSNVMVACPNACIADERTLRSDPGFHMRIAWGLGAGVILSLAVLRGCYLGN